MLPKVNPRSTDQQEWTSGLHQPRQSETSHVDDKRAAGLQVLERRAELEVIPGGAEDGAGVPTAIAMMEAQGKQLLEQEMAKAAQLAESRQKRKEKDAQQASEAELLAKARADKQSALMMELERKRKAHNDEVQRRKKLANEAADARTHAKAVAFAANIVEGRKTEAARAVRSPFLRKQVVRPGA
jgi:hypothetical protein